MADKIEKTGKTEKAHHCSEAEGLENEDTNTDDPENDPLKKLLKMLGLDDEGGGIDKLLKALMNLFNGGASNLDQFSEEAEPEFG